MKAVTSVEDPLQRALNRATDAFFPQQGFSITGKYAIRVDVFKILTGWNKNITPTVLREYNVDKIRP